MATELLQKYSHRVSQLLARKNDLDFELATITNELKQLQGQLLPDELLTLQIPKLTLSDGTEIKLEKKFQGGISYETGPAAASVLEANGYVFNWAANVKIPQERIAMVQAVLQNVAETYDLPDFGTRPDIHPQTFKKICRELDARGVLDEQTQQTLGVIVQYHAAVKTPE